MSKHQLLLVFGSLYMFAFWRSWLDILQTFSRPEFLLNAVAFTLIFSFLVYSVRRSGTYSLPSKRPHHLLVSALLVVIAALYIANDVVFQLSILPSVLGLVGLWTVSGLFLETRLWLRSLWVVGILVLTLPLLERVQRFIGFPVRLITAQTVSWLFSYFGIGAVSESAIIITENKVTHIDIPCSGVKSLYIGFIYLCAVYYIERVRVTGKTVAFAVLFLLSLFLFNTWRVFTLVYIYDILSFTTFGDAIHVGLGVGGFIISCVGLWYAVRTQSPAPSPHHRRSPLSEGTTPVHHLVYPVVLLLMLGFSVLLSQFFSPNPSAQVALREITFSVPGADIQEVPFTPQEKEFFVHNGIDFSGKYEGLTSTDLPFTLIIVSSQSTRAHHEPEICLQSFGNTIVSSSIEELDETYIRRLILNDEEQEVYYWFMNTDMVILDYHERIWEGIKNPGERWVLVQVAFLHDISSYEEKQRVMQGIQKSVREQVL